MDFSNIFMIILYIITGLLMLTILVVAHEGGHFFVGKKCGIGIVEFSVGMGPKIFSKIKKGIRYSVRCLPLGGFVRFEGEDDEDNNPRAFNNQPAWKRLITLIAGPFMNVFFAFVITLVVLIGFGDSSPYIAEVRQGTPAEEAGLMSGDRLASINGKTIDFYTELSLSSNADLFKRNGDYVELTVERNGEYLSYKIPFAQMEDGTKAIGITYGAMYRNFNFFEAVGLSFKWMYLLIAETLKTLGTVIFTGQGAENIMGPVGTVSYVGEAVVTYGPEVAFRLASILGISLAVINLIPFPGLDGGRIVFLGLEKITGNRIPKKAEGIVNFIGLILLFALIIFLTVQDVSKGLF